MKFFKLATLSIIAITSILSVRPGYGEPVPQPNDDCQKAKQAYSDADQKCLDLVRAYSLEYQLLRKKGCLNPRITDKKWHQLGCEVPYLRAMEISRQSDEVCQERNELKRKMESVCSKFAVAGIDTD